MIILELFSGTASFSNVAKERGHKVFTVDFDKRFNPDLCIDILKFDPSMLPEEFKKPFFIWASPPCTTFSVASIRHYWENGKPKNEKCLIGIEIVKKTIEIIKTLNPAYFIIENPRGMLRKQEFMESLPKRNTVSYCQYGLDIMKPTDLWNNLEEWKPRPICKPGSSCHQRAARGSISGTQGIIKNPAWEKAYNRSPVLRARVPRELCLEVLEYLESEELKTPPENPSSFIEEID